MQIENDVKLDFDDVLLKPKRSKIKSRSDVDTYRTFKFHYGATLLRCVPICASNMFTTGCFNVAKELYKHGLMTSLHKHYSVEQYVDYFSSEESGKLTFYSIGESQSDLDKLAKVSKRMQYSTLFPLEFPSLLMIDVANGYRECFVDFVKKVRDLYPKSILAVGNVVTPEMTEQLILSGADIVKVGIGSGAVCTTRLVAATGYPQLSAIIECADAAHGIGGHIMSDGGIVYPADVSKAIAANADFVMIGSYFAGTDECDGTWESDANGNKYLVHYGMSSETAMIKVKGVVDGYRASEGRTVRVPYKGPISNKVQELLGGIRSACSYSGASCIKDLSKRATFVRVSNTHNRVFEKN